MPSKLAPFVKTILYPSLLLAAHSLVENWPQLVTALGPHYAWLAGPMVVGIGGVILHQLDSPGNTPSA